MTSSLAGLIAVRAQAAFFALFGPSSKTPLPLIPSAYSAARAIPHTGFLNHCPPGLTKPPWKFCTCMSW
jgi:hypothetical protein